MCLKIKNENLSFTCTNFPTGGPCQEQIRVKDLRFLPYLQTNKVLATMEAGRRHETGESETKGNLLLLPVIT